MNPGQIAVYSILIYLSLLIILGVISNLRFRGTASDYFLASRGIGSFLLLMSLFGTTMTAFALIGSSGEAFKAGIGVYGKLVSWSGLIHSLCFFFLGIKLWRFGKKYGYVTQIQFFRDRFESENIGLVLFPVLVALVIPYLLVGVIGGGNAVAAVTRNAFPDFFTSTGGAIPFALGAGLICLVVLIYVFAGGVRGTAWANAFQTCVFIVLGIVAFFAIGEKLGGFENATKMVMEYNPAHLTRGVTDVDLQVYDAKMAAFEAGESPIRPKKPEEIPPLVFLTYAFIPLSVGMFPHLFQHWLTAKSAKSFKLAIVVHPLLMMLTWVPCVLIGVWATSAVVDGQAMLPQAPDFASSKVLPVMVAKLGQPLLAGLLVAGILAAIMSSLDSQFLCLSSIFTNDIAKHYVSRDQIGDRSLVMLGRIFAIAIVVVTYLLAIYLQRRSVFVLGVWCFTGFAGLAPLAFAALYWRRVTKYGAYACILAAFGVGGWMFWQADFGANRAWIWMGMQPVAGVVAASTLAMIVVSLVTRPPSEATIAKFFAGERHGE